MPLETIIRDVGSTIAFRLTAQRRCVNLTFELKSPSFQFQSDGSNLRFLAAIGAAKRRREFLQDMLTEKLEVLYAASDFNLFVHSFGWLSLASFQRMKPLRM